jgi:hypothetical protein
MASGGVSFQLAKFNEAEIVASWKLTPPTAECDGVWWVSCQLAKFNDTEIVVS